MRVPLALFPRPPSRIRLDVHDLALQVPERRRAADGPSGERREHGGDGVRGEVAEGSDGGDEDGLVVRIEHALHQARVYRRDDQVLQLPLRLETQLLQ